MYIRRHPISKGMTKPEPASPERPPKYVSAKAQAHLDCPHVGRRNSLRKKEEEIYKRGSQYQ